MLVVVGACELDVDIGRLVVGAVDVLLVVAPEHAEARSINPSHQIDDRRTKPRKLVAGLRGNTPELVRRGMVGPRSFSSNEGVDQSPRSPGCFVEPRGRGSC